SADSVYQATSPAGGLVVVIWPAFPRPLQDHVRATQECRHPSEGDLRPRPPRRGRPRRRTAGLTPDPPAPPALSEEAQLDRPRNGLRARRRAQLVVDRPEVGFYRVTPTTTR